MLVNVVHRKNLISVFQIYESNEEKNLLRERTEKENNHKILNVDS